MTQYYNDRSSHFFYIPIQINVPLHINSIHLHLPLHRRTRRHPRTITRRIYLHLHQILIQPSERSSDNAAATILRALHTTQDAISVTRVFTTVGRSEDFPKKLMHDWL